MAVDGRAVESLVERLRSVHGIDDPELRAHAAEVWAEFDGVPVQAFVPVLVEKRLREYVRLQSAPAAVRDRATG